PPASRIEDKYPSFFPRLAGSETSYLCEVQRLLVIGRGAREHAIAHKALLSRKLEVFIAPGNAGMQPPLKRVPLQETEIGPLRDFIRQMKIDAVIVGPEVPIARGIYDDLHDLTLVIAPSQKLAFLESSKARAKHFMQTIGIPTPYSVIFDQLHQADAESYLRGASYPLVIKASGLAAGKGVLIAHTPEEALEFARECFSGSKFGTAGHTILVEEYLSGEERSVFILSDGKGYVLLPTARDYKRLRDGDQGPNTGGMGGYAPADDSPEWIDSVREKIIEPTLHALKKGGTPYHGFLYFGLMKVGGEPYLLEYNVRLGDPEAQLILPLIGNSMEELIYYYRIQKLGELRVRLQEQYAVGVVAATVGYPEAPQKGQLLPSLPLEEGGCKVDDSGYIYWAGVEADESGMLYTTGGRTYTAVGIADTLETARARAYAILEKVPFEGRYYRTDIALR
ncbi:MAG: phosphoribosylamine--glycine ligase, partial [Bacteroidia bacterium]|nr:phosphoribosylamine--glycine ligase [Bacteroidia bacterium]MDW8015918.1 phosphoribosylamine--glycine ligase [Bacteroidia bacterium]